MSVKNVADNTGFGHELIGVLTAYRNGNFKARLPTDFSGQNGKIADLCNQIMEQSAHMSEEFARVGEAVGREGRLEQRLDLPGLRGEWRKIMSNSNQLLDDMVSPATDLLRVFSAVAQGDLSQSVSIEVAGTKLQGQHLQSANIVNTMVEQLRAFSGEVTRVAREVGTEGVLGGQAHVSGVSGTWKDLTDNVNGMASSLTAQVRNIAEVTTAVAQGDLSRKITVDARGEVYALKETVNTMVDQLSDFAEEVTRVAREVGTEGVLGGQAHVSGVSGTWKDLTDNVNGMATNLTNQVRNIAEVTTAVAQGDLSHKITVDAAGEVAALKATVNTMVDQLGTFAEEVTRVARQVGTDGVLGGQADVPGVSGIWANLTNNVNGMATNLTNQVRNIAEVTTAVAQGDLSHKITVDAAGEVAALKATVNTMVDQLDSFAGEVTRVAREVGTEGVLGGQAHVPGVSGTWKDLTDNVNNMASSLTVQVRAIAEVAEAVTDGDYSRNIYVEVRGEVDDLKRSVNHMIDTLRVSTRQNNEQDWLKTNLAKMSHVLQKKSDHLELGRGLLGELGELVDCHAGALFIASGSDEASLAMNYVYGYAHDEGRLRTKSWKLGEGLVGQCARERHCLLITGVPDDYIDIGSGLGSARPQNLMLLPLVFEETVLGVLEVASFNTFTPLKQSFLEQLAEAVGIILYTLDSNVRTKQLLSQSQSLAAELQSQQDELRRSNEELEDKALMLAQQKAEVEHKNGLIEATQQTLEERAEQLARTSRYKSEFLSSMSHELRTPLNSLLLLSKRLADNREGNMNARQVEFAETVHAAGNDLLELINEILDLAKIESGTVMLDVAPLSFAEVQKSLRTQFMPVAERKDLRFDMTLDEELPASMFTDRLRILQVLKNLLSNAFKFTDTGTIRLSIRPALSGWSKEHVGLGDADTVIAFEVADTGIGIGESERELVFEAFQQADTGTSRKYGGTGLGLSISRELATLLGGELVLHESSPDRGSTFVCYLPSKAYEQKQLRQRETSLTLRSETKVGLGEHGLTEKPAPTQRAPEDFDQAPKGNCTPPSRGDRCKSSHLGPKTLLVVDGDGEFSKVVKEQANQLGLNVAYAPDGEKALGLLETANPDLIWMDSVLPDISGLDVLDCLRANSDTHHVPVTVTSYDECKVLYRRAGVYSQLNKPVAPERVQSVLRAMLAALESPRQQIFLAGEKGQLAKSVSGSLRAEGLEVSLIEDLDRLQSQHPGPSDIVVVNADPDRPAEVGQTLQVLVKSPNFSDRRAIVLLGDESSIRQIPGLDKLEEEAQVVSPKCYHEFAYHLSVMLSRPLTQFDDATHLGVRQILLRRNSLAGRRLLLVDDDMRNIFAFTALLEDYEAEISHVTSGQAALEHLNASSKVDLIVMDIMMPEMDGYETIRCIRKLDAWGTVPIVALTAKAMPGDRDACIAAGATEYFSKPIIDGERLVSAIRRLIVSHTSKKECVV